MAKRLTEKQKEEILQSFKDGKTVASISHDFNCTKLTIIRNLKKNLGESNYKDLINQKQQNTQPQVSLQKKSKKDRNNIKEFKETRNESDFNPVASFIEISPLEYEIENSSRKELSSIPLSEIDFSQIVYMVVNKQIELEIKLLKDYPEWQFLPSEDLNRKTIEIYNDLKTAKRYCSKDQKVIKVPNTDVFRIVAPILISRGISRIVNADILIAL